MRRDVGVVVIQEAVAPTQTLKTQEAQNVQKTHLSAKQRYFETPSVKPALPTLIVTDAQKVQGLLKPSAEVHAAARKSLPTPDTMSSPQYFIPYMRPIIHPPPQRHIVPPENTWLRWG